MTINHDALVEKGAQAMYERNPFKGISWGQLDHGVRVEYRKEVSAVLDAILPDVQADVWDEALVASADAFFDGDNSPIQNPYRKVASK